MEIEERLAEYRQELLQDYEIESPKIGSSPIEPVSPVEPALHEEIAPETVAKPKHLEAESEGG